MINKFDKPLPCEKISGKVLVTKEVAMVDTLSNTRVVLFDELSIVGECSNVCNVVAISENG